MVPIGDPGNSNPLPELIVSMPGVSNVTGGIPPSLMAVTIGWCSLINVSRDLDNCLTTFLVGAFPGTILPKMEAVVRGPVAVMVDLDVMLISRMSPHEVHCSMVLELVVVQLEQDHVDDDFFFALRLPFLPI